jgi:hypothetical protein
MDTSAAMDGDGHGGAGHGPAQAGQAAADAPGIDMAVLAQKVYRLMREELRLDRARGGALFMRRT